MVLAPAKPCLRRKGCRYNLSIVHGGAQDRNTGWLVPGIMAPSVHFPSWCPPVAAHGDLVAQIRSPCSRTGRRQKTVPRLPRKPPTPGTRMQVEPGIIGLSIHPARTQVPQCPPFRSTYLDVHP